nr:MAG TPA: hypothetical protein [Caudoviricetes sp.]
MNTIVNLLVKYFNLVKIIKDIKCKGINGMYIILPVDQLYTLKDDLDDYIFITRNEYINNILEPLKYFTPSEKVIIYRDYRNIIRHNIFDEYRKKKIG